jgi:excisionase family DNA binding protein
MQRGERVETLMTAEEVAGVTRLAVATVRKYVLRKSIPFLKIGASVRFRPSEIEDWIARRGRGAEGKSAGELFSEEGRE